MLCQLVRYPHKSCEVLIYRASSLYGLPSLFYSRWISSYSGCVYIFHQAFQDANGQLWLMAKPHHYVYVILLRNEVLAHKKFKSANPDYGGVSPCVYVGMTGLDPDTRFDKHKAGIKANTYVKLYGERLMPELVADLKQPMSFADAKYLEVDVAIKLRELGYAVWQA